MSLIRIDYENARAQARQLEQSEQQCSQIAQSIQALRQQLPACGPEKPPIHTIRQPSAGCARSERSRMSCRVLRTRSARP